MVEPDKKPTPDPTRLTTDQLERSEERMLREVGTIKELVEQRITALRELLTCDIEGARAVREEEFQGVSNQLAQIEKQRVEQKQDTKAAVDAALQAAKEAVKEQTTASEARTDKSEASTIKSIEQLGTTFATDISAARREISDLKDRMTSVEQQKVGREENKTEHRDAVQPFQVMLAGGLATLFVSILVVVLNIVTGA